MTPLLGIGVCVSIQFAGLEYSKRVFSSRNVSSGIGDGSLTGSQYFASGVIAGLANSVVSGPVEHIRIREYILSEMIRLALRLTRSPQVCRLNPIKHGCMLVHGMLARRSMPLTGSPEFTRAKSRHSAVKLADTVSISGRTRN